MASINDQLFPCSFRGVPFLIEKSDTRSGRKTVTHEFPNSDSRFVEDLGQLRSVFTITGWISGDFYFGLRNELIRALDTPGIGILVHPFLGLREVTSTTYRVEEKTNSLGIAIFTMTFEESQPNKAPLALINTSAEIAQDIIALMSSLSDNTSSEFSVSKNSSINFNSALKKINSCSDLFTEATKQYVNDEEFINNFSDILLKYKENSILLVSDPSDLGASNSDLFNGANELASTSLEGFELMTRFFDYGDDDDPIDPITISRSQRLKNNEIFNIQIQGSALALAYENAIVDTYLTVQQIEDTITILEDQYFKLSRNDFIEPVLLDEITTLRSRVIAFFKKLELTTYKLSTITTFTTPITILTYQYYGSLDLVDTLIGLNSIHDVSFTEGELQVLTK